MSIVTIDDTNLINIATAIRNKKGSSDTYKPSEMAKAIKDIQSGAEPILQEVMIFPKTEEIIIMPSEDYDGISKVIVNPVTSDIDGDIKSTNIKKGVNILGIDGTLEEGITPSGTLPITSNGNYNVTNYANASVNVPSVEPTGEIEITVNGTYNVKDYASANVQIEGGGGAYAPRSISFHGYTGTDLQEEINGLDISNLTSMGYMFYNCKSLTRLYLPNWDTSKITSMNSMFYYCSTLTNLDVSMLNTSNVTDMSSMFSNCRLLKSLDVSNFNTSKVESMSSMFSNCRALEEIDLSNFDVSNLTTMESMFNGCSKLKRIILKGWNPTNNTRLNQTFYNCSVLEFIDMRDYSLTSKISNSTSAFGSVPTNCEIIVKDDSSKSWLKGKFNTLTNIKTLAEYQAEGGV